MSREEKRAMRKMLNNYLKYKTDFAGAFQIFCVLANKTKGSYNNQ